MNTLFSGNRANDHDVMAAHRAQLLKKVEMLHTYARVLDIASDPTKHRRYANKFLTVVIEYNLVLVQYLDLYQHVLTELGYRWYLSVPEDIVAELVRLQEVLKAKVH